MIRFNRLAALLFATALPASALAVGLLDSSLEKHGSAPIREGEQPVIPLDTKDPSYNIWDTLRDTSGDPKREPGIINVQKYDMGYSWAGVPTFFHLPIALTPEDLKASKVEVAIMGAYTDMGSCLRRSDVKFGSTAR